MGSSLPPVALIAGPTASGKSALAIALAKARDGVVINADSAQVYRDLRVLTARPTLEEEAEVPHRLYGYRDGAEPLSAADWSVDAREAIDDVHSAGKLPIVTGGTGLYIRTLIEGIAPVPEIDPDIRKTVRALRVEETYAALLQEDPDAALRLKPTDTSRVARALEVVRSTATPLAAWQQTRSGGIGDRISLAPLVLLPPRTWLYERCDARFAAMLSDDGLAEAAALLARGLDPALPVMRAIGVVESVGLATGSFSLEQALASGRSATRRYAKRQYTWFSRQSPAHWPRFVEPMDTPQTIEAGLDLFAYLK